MDAEAASPAGTHGPRARAAAGSAPGARPRHLDGAGEPGGAGDAAGDRVDALIARLTLEEKVSLLAGRDVWRLAGVERIGVPALVISDGPAGVRGASFLSGRSHSFPCEAALAATWDPELVAEVGAALGDEAGRRGVDVLLAPTVNLHRHPLGGRNFECFSEDPYLTDRMAEAYVTGVQARGVKHLVCNDSEFERHTISSEADEATLREVYLLPFEAAVRSGVPAVMASNNKLNSPACTYPCQRFAGVLAGDDA